MLFFALSVSQMEHGVLHLVNVEDPRITVLMDCEGVSSFRFPMQMMRSCSTLMQDHFPNRLAVLFLLRLPPVVRVIAQTLIQRVLRPSTRSKVRFEGETYLNVLHEYLETVPACLGGNCRCDKCQMLPVGYRLQAPAIETIKRGLSLCSTDEDMLGDQDLNDLSMDGGCEQIIRTAIVGILMVWIFIALLATMFDQDGHFSFS